MPTELSMAQRNEEIGVITGCERKGHTGPNHAFSPGALCPVLSGRVMSHCALITTSYSRNYYFTTFTECKKENFFLQLGALCCAPRECYK